MPYKKKYYNKKKKYSKRKRSGRKYRKVYSKAKITRVRGTGFSDTTFVKLNYVDRLTLSPGATYCQYTFRGNSLFDPDYTGTGHQPMYFDQYTAIYNKYRVLASSITIDAADVSGDSALYMICTPNTDVLTATSIPLVMEQTGSVAPRMIPIAQRGPMPKLKLFATTRKVMGLSKGEINDDTYSATSGANPSNIWYWNIFFSSVDDVHHVIASVIVKLTYYVQFYDRLPGIQS